MGRTRAFYGAVDGLRRFGSWDAPTEEVFVLGLSARSSDSIVLSPGPHLAIGAAAYAAGLPMQDDPPLVRDPEGVP